MGTLGGTEETDGIGTPTGGPVRVSAAAPSDVSPPEGWPEMALLELGGDSLPVACEFPSPGVGSFSALLASAAHVLGVGEPPSLFAAFQIGGADRYLCAAESRGPNARFRVPFACHMSCLCSTSFSPSIFSFRRCSAGAFCLTKIRAGPRPDA